MPYEGRKISKYSHEVILDYASPDLVHHKIVEEMPQETTSIQKVESNLTHWGRVTHICVGKLINIGSDNGLSPGRRQANHLSLCWNIVNSTLRNKLQWNINRNWYISIQENAFENVVCEMSAILSRPQCVKAWNNLCATASEALSCHKLSPTVNRQWSSVMSQVVSYSELWWGIPIAS